MVIILASGIISLFVYYFKILGGDFPEFHMLIFQHDFTQILQRYLTNSNYNTFNHKSLS